MLEKDRDLRAVAAAGAAGAAAALFYGAIAAGRDANWAAGLLLGGGCAAAPWIGEETAWAAAAAWLTAPILIPLIGAKALVAAGAAAAAAGLWKSTRRGAAPEPWLLALACAAAVPWIRLLSSLLGNPVLGLAAALGGLCAGAGLGRWARRKLGESALSAEVGAVVSGAALALAVHFFRFLGLNAGEPTFLHAPVRCASDLFFLGAPAALAMAAWSLPVAAGGRSSALPVPGPSRLAAPLLPLASAWLTGRLGPAPAAALCGAALVAYGAWRYGGAWRSASPTPKVLGAVAAVGLLAAATCGDPLRDIWLNRLNAAYPGGRFLYLDDKGPRARGAYVFSTGLLVLVDDGVVDADSGPAAALEADLPLLARGQDARDVLLVDAANPLTLQAASKYGAAVDVLDRDEDLDRFREAMTSGSWKLPAGMRKVPQPGPAYDVVIVDVPAPLHSPQAARRTTRAELARWHKLLKPGGVLALRAPKPWFGSSMARLLGGVRAEFKEAGAFELAGSLLVVASDEFITADPFTLRSRIPGGDPALGGYINDQLRWIYPLERLPLDGTGAETLDRSRTAIPIRDILTTPAPPA